MKDSQNRPLWNVNVSTAGPDTLLGAPVYVHPDLPTAAANNISVLYGDFNRGYLLRRVNGFSMQRLNELYANTGQIGYRGWERVDGRVGIAAAIIALKHSAT